MVFIKGEPEPKSMIDIPSSLASELSQNVYGIYRLYVADLSNDAESRYRDICNIVDKW
jgi:hypothetical protein